MKIKPKELIDNSNYIQSVSSLRLKKIQNFLQKGKNEIILLPLGIDSRYNQGCKQLADFLLFDFFTEFTPKLEKAGFEEEFIDDVIITIRFNSVAVYCNPFLYNYLLPFVAGWNNLSLYCLQTEDQDELELYKVKSFIEMVNDCKQVYVSYYSPDADEFNKFLIEKWPLVQSYALEETGKGIFFTMNHEVCNIFYKLLPIFNEIDLSKLDKILVQSLSLIQRHWLELKNMFTYSKDLQLTNICQSSTEETLLSFYEHGKRYSKKNSLNKDEIFKPFVRFGHQTLTNVSNNPNIMLHESGVNKTPALHMMACSVCPTSLLTCTRTYFFPPSKNSSVNLQRNYERLLLAYQLCVEAASFAVETFCKTNNFIDSKLKTESFLKEKIDFKKSKISVLIGLIDTNQSDDKNLFLKLKYICVNINDISSVEDEELLLGSVGYSDTFIDSYIEIDGQIDNDVSSIFITSAIDKFVEFTISEEHLEDNFVNSDVVYTDVYLCSSSNLLNSNNLNIVLNFDFSSNLNVKIDFKNSQSLVINIKQIEKIQIVPFTQPIIQVFVKSSFHPLLSSSSSDFCFGLIFSSEDFISFKSKVLPRLNQLLDDCNLKIETTKSINHLLALSYEATSQIRKWQLKNPHPNFQHYLWFDDKTTFNYNKTLLYVTYPIQPGFEVFRNHFEICSTFAGHKLSRDYLQILKSSEKDSECKDQVTITVVAGLPTSNVTEVCSSLITINKERLRWVIIKCVAKNNNPNQLDHENLQEQLRNVVAKRKSVRPGVTANKKLRIIISSTQCFDLSHIISCVLSHHDDVTRNHMSLGCVVTCVDQMSCYVKSVGLLLPQIMSQSQLCNCIIFTSSHQQDSKNLEEIQKLFRLVNSNVAFIIAENGKLFRSTDFEMLMNEKSFDKTKKNQILHFPHLLLSDSDQFDPSDRLNQIERICINFSNPIFRGVFETRLRAINKMLHLNVLFVEGTTQFIGENVEKEISSSILSSYQPFYKVIEKKSALSPVPPSKKASQEKSAEVTEPQNQLVFYGLNLNQKLLVDWIKKCGRQKKSKKSYKTLSTLTSSELQKIQKLHQLDPLPEGYFFSGTQYCNLLDDLKTDKHPYFDKFVEEYLVEENRKVDEYNQKISAGDFSKLA